MIRQQLFIGAALIAGVAIGYFAAPSDTVRAVPSAEESSEAPGAIADRGESATIAALRARVKELEGRLASDRASGEELISEAVTRLENGRSGREFPRSQKQWAEEMRKNNPQQYVQMTNRMAQWRRTRLERQQSRLDFLSSVSTAGMSAGARQTHERLQDLIVQREEIESEMRLDLDDEERRDVFNRMREVDHEINRLNAEERQNLLNETAKALGLGDEDAKALGETVQQIIDATGSAFGGPVGGPGRGGRGGPRGR